MRRLAMAIVAAAALLGAGAWAPPKTVTDEDKRAVVLAVSYDVRSTVLKENRRINVYLPAGYAEGQARYPVLYLLDGGEQEDFIHIAGLAQISGASGATRPFIVVGIQNVDRRRDFTFRSNDPQDRRDAPTQGGSEAFRRFLERDLNPWVERNFRASGETALMGESLAGLFVVDTFLRQPELFDAYIAVSPSLWWDRGSTNANAVGFLRARTFADKRLFLTVADEGPAMGVDAFAEILRAADLSGLDWTLVHMEGETHATTFHPSAMKAVRRIFAPPPAKKPNGG